ncbi:MAG: 30S ribosomal protein S20 [Planctomycetes bacterium]|nr:30S ribosomal protein S20 [Planctomycetota bacterium]
MPHSASAKKRNRQNLRNRERNRKTKSELKSHVRKVLAAIEAGDVPQAREALRIVASSADKAAAAHKIHRNKAARIKSRLSAKTLAASKGVVSGATATKAASPAAAKSSGAAKGKGKKSIAKKPKS